MAETTAIPSLGQATQIPWWRRMSGQNIMRALILYPLTICGAAVMLVPVLWLISSSLKSTVMIFIFPPQWIPDPVRWENYTDVFRVIPFARFTLNTVIVTGFAMLGQVVSAALVAFGFARLRFPGRNVLFIVLLSTIMIPYHITLIPTFVLFRMLGWLDSFLPLIVPYWFGGGAFFIFLLRQFFMRLPLELDDAAYIDGANVFDVFLRVLLPQAKPALGVVAVFSFLNHWNDFFGPLIYLNSVDNYTLAVGINLFRSAQITEWNLLMAASVMISLPCIALYALAQRYFIQGIVFTGLKQ